MVRSIGIDPGDQAVKVVEVDGSYKKTRLLALHVAPAGAATADGSTRVEAIAAAVEQARSEGMRGECVLGHPCREAVLRVIELPFKGHDAIRKVVKSEIEGEIQSQSIDDMVVDFHEIGSGQTGGTRILVASVPKPGLRAVLGALAERKVEPDRIDLDTMALWRAAHWLGAFAAAGPATPDAPPPVTAVVDIGARSVRVLLVEGEQLVEMRALRLGDGVVAEEIARRHGLDAVSARDVVRKCLATGADQQLEVAAALPAPDGVAPVEGAPPSPPRAVVVAHGEVESAHTAYLQRLARELTRFLTASGKQSRLGSVFVTGGASRNPGTAEMLAAVFGVECKELDVLGRLQHDLTPEQVAEHGHRLATALGLALAHLGGPEGFQLLQEDLVQARGFERVKFPLAIACMVAMLALFVHWNKKHFELTNLEFQIGRTFVNKDKPKDPPLFYGLLNAVFATGWFDRADQFRLEQQRGKDYTSKDLLAELVAAPVHKRLGIVHDRVRAVANQKQKESGVYEDVSIESGFAVLTRWSELMKGVESELGRFLVTRIDLNMKSGVRRLEFTIAFRGEDFRSRRQQLQRAIDAEFARADSPFEAPKRSDERKDEDTFKDIADSGVPGAYFRVTLPIKDVFAPFGMGAGTAALGLAPARTPPPPLPGDSAGAGAPALASKEEDR
jgi:Tfp pilus assembly PilM family ATPase